LAQVTYCSNAYYHIRLQNAEKADLLTSAYPSSCYYGMWEIFRWVPIA